MMRMTLAVIGALALTLIPGPAQAMVTPTVKVVGHTVTVTTRADAECSFFSVNLDNTKGRVRSKESTTGSVRFVVPKGRYEVYVWAFCPNGGASDTWLALDKYVRVR